jgi:hypothetical protein
MGQPDGSRRAGRLGMSMQPRIDGCAGLCTTRAVIVNNNGLKPAICHNGGGGEADWFESGRQKECHCVEMAQCRSKAKVMAVAI